MFNTTSWMSKFISRKDFKNILESGPPTQHQNPEPNWRSSAPPRKQCLAKKHWATIGTRYKYHDHTAITRPFYSRRRCEWGVWDWNWDTEIAAYIKPCNVFDRFAHFGKNLSRLVVLVPCEHPPQPWGACSDSKAWPPFNGKTIDLYVRVCKLGPNQSWQRARATPDQVPR